MPFGKAAEFEQFQMLMNEFESISERTFSSLVQRESKIGSKIQVHCPVRRLVL